MECTLNLTVFRHFLHGACVLIHIFTKVGGGTHHAYSENNRCQCTKFSHMGDLIPGICAPLSQKTIIFISMTGQKDIFAHIHHEMYIDANRDYL